MTDFKNGWHKDPQRLSRIFGWQVKLNYLASSLFKNNQKQEKLNAGGISFENSYH